jgi:hypothetical protein
MVVKCKPSLSLSFELRVASSCLMPYDSRILPDKYSGTPINPVFNLLGVSYPACCFRQVLCPGGSRTVEFSF